MKGSTQALRGCLPSPILSFAVAWCAAALSLPVAAACGDDVAEPGRQQFERDGVVVVLAPSIWPIPVGRHFGATLTACTNTRDGRVEGLRLDADMPLHRHGMNYRSSIRQVGQGRFEAQGLMFHMPGRWRLIVDVDIVPAAGGGVRTLRMTRELDLE